MFYGFAVMFNGLRARKRGQARLPDCKWTTLSQTPNFGYEVQLRILAVRKAGLPPLLFLSAKAK